MGPDAVPKRFEVEEIKGPAIQERFALPRTPFGPDTVILLLHPDTGAMAGTVVIDNLVMGPSLGGTRLASDLTVKEVYGLASAMTFKNAAAMLPIGGGKSGLLGDPDYYFDRPAAKEQLITAFAEAIWPFRDYIPGPDMGTDEKDMQLIYDVFSRMNGAPHHGRGGVGRPPDRGGLPLDEWGLTAHGLFAAARTLEGRNHGFQIEGARVIVQGYGNVGSPCARKLANEGARVVGVSDIHAALYNPEGLDLDELDSVRRHREGLGEYSGPVKLRFGPAELDDLLALPCDMLVPAARPDAITERNADSVQARVILEGANNPVSPGVERYLARKHGVICMTDFIVNAGGVIACAVELRMDTDTAYRNRVLDEDGCGRAYMEELVYRIVSTNVEAICDRLGKGGGDRTWRDAALDLAEHRLSEGQAHEALSS